MRGGGSAIRYGCHGNYAAIPAPIEVAWFPDVDMGMRLETFVRWLTSYQATIGHVIKNTGRAVSNRRCASPFGVRRLC